MFVASNITFDICNIMSCQVRSQPSRECTKNAGSYCDFLFDTAFDSDNDGVLEEFDVSSSEDEDEKYDPENEVFDKKKGEDNWVGRRIIKSFGAAGEFEGIVYAVDNDDNKKGYRLFLMYYFEDPDDGESMWPEELYRYVMLTK